VHLRPACGYLLGVSPLDEMAKVVILVTLENELIVLILDWNGCLCLVIAPRFNIHFDADQELLSIPFGSGQ